METKRNESSFKSKTKNISHHLFLSEKRIDYLLLFDSKQPSLVLYSLQEHMFTPVARTEVSAGQPVVLAVDGNDNVILLHTLGICLWSVTQIMDGCAPQRRDIKWPSTPLKIIPLGSDQYVVVCAGNLLTFLKKQGGQSDVGYDSEFLLEKNQHKNLITTEDCLYVMAPSNNAYYPYIFTRKEVKSWEKAGFLANYSKVCRKHYLEDERLSQKEYCFSFCPQNRTTYLCLATELRILEWRNHSEVGIVMSLRLRVRARWTQTPVCCSINPRTGGMSYVTSQRVGHMQPLEYTDIKKYLKQHSDGSINWIYHSGDWSLMVALHGAEKDCKFYLMPPQNTL